jgi:hypothetical protein
MYENIIPLVAPVDGTTTSPASPYIDLQASHHATFLVYFGVVTSTTDTDTMTVTLEASTASTSDASEEAIPFNYRYSAAHATSNTWSAVTAATSAGVSMGASDAFDGFMLLVDVDEGVLVGLKPDARWVRLQLTPSAAYSVLNYCSLGFADARYKQTTMKVQTVT